MWLQIREDDGAPLVYFHQVKHMWVGYVDGRSGAVEEDAGAGERQAKAQVLTAQKVEPKQAVLWMQMQRDAQVAACVDSTSRTVEVWGPTRQVLALALYVRETVRRSRGMAGEWDPDTEMRRVRKVMAMVDYNGAAMGRAKGHTVPVVSPQARGHRPGTGRARMVGVGTQGGQAQGGSVYGGPVETSGTPTHAMGGGIGGGTG